MNPTWYAGQCPAGRSPTMADQTPRRPGADPARISPEIYVYATAKNFLNIYDALRIEKFKIEVASYDPGSGKQTGLAAAWLDMDEMRLLIHLITLRLFPTVRCPRRCNRPASVGVHAAGRRAS